MSQESTEVESLQTENEDATFIKKVHNVEKR